MRNITNILTIKDHQENVGMYWYARIEVFLLHQHFFIWAYLLFQAIMLMQIRLIYKRCDATIRIVTQHDVNKFHRRLLRTKITTVYLIAYFATMFAQYPLFLDSQYSIILLICCNMRFVGKYFEGIWFMLGMWMFAVVNTLFMWLTW